MRWTTDELNALDEALRIYGRNWKKIKQVYGSQGNGKLAHRETNNKISAKAKKRFIVVPFLPCEIILKIALYTDTRSFSRMCQVNKLWNILLDTELIWNQMFSRLNLSLSNDIYTQYTRKTLLFSLSLFRCIECRKKTDTMCLFNRIPICYSCKKQTMFFRTICTTQARQDYFLTNNDLESIQSVHVCNPHYRSAPPMRLFLETEVSLLSVTKFGSENLKLLLGLDDDKKAQNKLKKFLLKQRSTSPLFF